MIKNRHKALTLWARARDYECQRSIKEARQRSEERIQKTLYGARTLDNSQQFLVNLTS